MDKVFQGDAFNHIIANYLDIRDIYHLGLTCKDLYKKMDLSMHIKRRIIIRLQEILGDFYPEFVDKMIESRACISGSLILQCILNEKWSNSDIDIYVSCKLDSRTKHESPMMKFLENKTHDFDDTSYRAMYDVCSVWNFYLHSESANRSSSNDFYLNGLEPSNNSFLELDETKIQLVEIYDRIKCFKCMNNFKRQTKEEECIYPGGCKAERRTLWDHVQDTGFDICKNMVYFDKNRKMQIKIKDVKQILNKTTVFSVLDVDDFYFRLKKYSERGFYFRPRYNKLLCLEYLLFKKHNFEIVNHSNKLVQSSKKFTNCKDNNCPIKIFYRNMSHKHGQIRSFDEKGMPDGFKNIVTVNPNNHMFDKLIQKFDLNFAKMINNCQNLDEYVKQRNNFVSENKRVGIYNKNPDFDIHCNLFQANPPRHDF